MGRPINKKFFGNKNFPYQDQAVGGPTGDGGEGVIVTVSNSGTTYSQGTVVTIGGGTQLTGGIPATISYSINTAGNIAVSVTNAGTGYTSAPTVTVTKAATVTSTSNSGVTATNTFTVTTVTGIAVGMLIAGAATGSSGRVQSVVGNIITTDVVNNNNWTNASNLTFTDTGVSFAKTVTLFASTVTQNAIAFTSFLLAKDGGASAVAGGDIMKQESSRRYLVNNSQGRGQVKLVAKNTLVAGQMNLIATDFGGSTYFVTKLTAHKATLVNQYGTGTALVTLTTDADGVKTGATGWTLGSATGTTVTIASV